MADLTDKVLPQILEVFRFDPMDAFGHVFKFIRSIIAYNLEWIGVATTPGIMILARTFRGILHCNTLS